MLSINLLLMSNVVTGLLGGFIGLIVAVPTTYYVVRMVQKNKASKDSAKAKSLLDEAKNEAKNLKKEAILEAKEEAFRLTSECDQELKERRAEMQKAENRINQREEFLDKKEETIEKKNDALEKAKSDLAEKEAKLNKKIEEQALIEEKMVAELERISKLSKDDAKKELISKFEDEAKKEAAVIVREIENNAKNEANKKAKEIVTLAIQKTAVDHTSEVTVSTVALPNDEVKGRIIGREGRNIRALESATGVDLIIDDTPEAVVLSSFDPVRREIAKLALEKLVADGRIHPVRIEEMVEKARVEIEQKIKQEGENAAMEMGIMNINKELIKTLGRLYYRTSYGQNVLLHSLEVGHIAGMIAAEIGANVKVAKRAGLLHDIGKAVDQTQEGTHIELGVELARKYGEKEEIIHAIEAHHDDVTANTIEAVLVKLADAVSAGRPGSRRDTLEIYIKRLQKLEEIALSYDGIKQSFAVQAGREIRVVVQPEKFDDVASTRLARDIARRIEEELDYPGQIRVTVVREIRTTEIAK